MNRDDLVEYFEYLDELRESGATNMWGAGAYVSDEYGFDAKKSNDIVGKWMETFDSNKTPSERVANVILR